MPNLEVTDFRVFDQQTKADAIIRSIADTQRKFFAERDLRALKVTMPKDLYYTAISSFKFLKYMNFGTDITGTHPYPYLKLFGMDVEIGAKLSMSAGPEFGPYSLRGYALSDVTVPFTWKPYFITGKLTVFVKTRARPFTCSDSEIKAIETLREMISELEYRKFVKYGFIIVTAKSRKQYQVFREHRHTKVWEKGKLVEDICVEFKDKTIPLTDKLIAFKTMIETDEDVFRKLGNVFKFKNVAITEENEFQIISRSQKKEYAELIARTLNNAEYTKNMLKDVESFCEGRIKLGKMNEAYKDVLFLVRQHIKGNVQ